jgi:hypothetical protein
LLLYTEQRRSDVVKMGRQHIRDGWLHVKQAKTGAKLEIPMSRMPELQQIIDASPVNQLTFIVTHSGKPFAPISFSNWFRLKCDEAGLPTVRHMGFVRLAHDDSRNTNAQRTRSRRSLVTPALKRLCGTRRLLTNAD